MSSRFVLAGVLAAALGAAGGYFIGHRSTADTTPDLKPTDEATRLAATAERAENEAAAKDIRIAQLEQQIATLRHDLTEQMSAIATLQAEKDAAAEAQQDELARAAKAAKADREKRIDDLVSRIQELKGSEYSSFLKPGVMADLVADIKALGDDGIGAMLAMLASESPEERRLAAQIMMSLNDPRTIEPLRDVCLNDDDDMARLWASQALMRLDGPEAVRAMRDVIANSPSEGARVNSLWGLCRAGDENGVRMAMEYYDNEENDKNMRRALGTSIFLVGSPKALPFADRVRKDYAESGELMGLAVQYYKSLNSPAGRERLQEMINDPKTTAEVREMAQQALNG